MEKTVAANRLGAADESPRSLAAGVLRPPRLCVARPPWWLWPNLLALDAPLVAVVWQHALAPPEEIGSAGRSSSRARASRETA